MPRLTNADAAISYTDHGGSGRPVVLIHGWPLRGSSWDPTVGPLLDGGYRVITYDRRGFGDSTMSSVAGYDYNLLTSDLAALLDELDLHDVTLVGFSMGGGEVARFVGQHGVDRVHSLVFIAAIPPWLLNSEDNPAGGLDMPSARSMQEALRSDRPAFLDGFLTGFFSANGQLRVTEEQRQAALAMAAAADLDAAAECITLWTTDFTADVARISVPTLILHGDADAIVPLSVSGARLHALVDGSILRVIPGGPHGLIASHTDEVNAALLQFLII